MVLRRDLIKQKYLTKTMRHFRKIIVIFFTIHFIFAQNFYHEKILYLADPVCLNMANR